VQLALWSGLALVLILSVATDLRSRRIPDLVSYPALAFALGTRAYFEGLGGAEAGLLSGLLGSLLAFGIFALLAWRQKMGWGDAKLMAVVGAAFGYPHATTALVLVSICGWLQAVAALLWQRRAQPQPQAQRVRHIPYAVAIALGSFWAMWWQHSTMLG
jgi:prepilin peptidase CpaA